MVASISREDTRWIQRHFPSLDALDYVVDDPQANLTTPKNKGNEAVAYLTYIIDHYETLPDVSIFVHAHRGPFPRLAARNGPRRLPLGSGRVWEYNWQFVFCPAMDTCYCRGYGICFGSRTKFETWWEAWTAAKQSFRDYLRLKAAGAEDLELRQRIKDEKERLRKVLEEVKRLN